MKINILVLMITALFFSNYAISQDLSVCGRSVDLNANVENYSSFSWFCDDVNGTFSNSNSLNTTFTLANDVNLQSFLDVRFYYNANVNGEIASDTIDVRFYKQPSARINMSPGDTAVCGSEYEFLRAELPGDGITGMWYEERPLTMFGPQNAAISSPTAPAIVTNYGRHEYYWILYTLVEGQDPSFCTDTAGPWHIDFIQQPTAQIAETEHTFCGYYGELSELHVSSSVGTGTWSSNISQNIVSFNEANNPGTIVNTTILNSGNTQYPYFDLYWVVTNTQYCAAVDTVQVIFAKIPSGEFSVIPPKCFGESAIITATDRTLPLYTWGYQGAFGDDTVSNTAGGDYQMFIHWDKDNMLANGDSVHNVTLVTTNEWGCSSAMYSLNVREPHLLEYTPTIMDDVCGTGTGYVQFADTTVLFIWIDTVAGDYQITALDSFRVSNLREGEYSYRTVYQTFNTNYRVQYFQYFGNESCIDTLIVEVGTIGLIEADFAVSADVIGNLEAPANAIFVNYTNYDNIGNCTCEWHFGDGAIVNNCNELVGHLYTVPNCYEPYLIVMKRDLPECRDTAFLDDCLLIRSDVADFYYSNISISPNPATNILNITSPETISEIEIVNVMGQVVKRIEVNSDNVVCDVEDLKADVYIVRIHGTNTESVICQRKFVKE